TAADPSWSEAQIDPGESLTAVSCAPGGPCVAVDGRGDAFVNLPAGSSSWSSLSIDGTTPLTGVSCPTASMCVAVDNAGDVLSSVEPTGAAAAWHSHSVDPGGPLAVSCASASLCVAVD